MDIIARIAELVAMGVPSDLAGQIAGQEVLKLQTELTAVQEASRKEIQAKTDEQLGVKSFLGKRIANMKGDRPTKYSKAMENGLAVEPANKGLDSNGKAVLWPPQFWLFASQAKPLNFTQAESQTLLSAIEGAGPERFIEALRTIASTDAVKAYNEQRKALETSGEILSRHKQTA